VNDHSLFVWVACAPALVLLVVEAAAVCWRLRRAKAAAVAKEWAAE